MSWASLILTILQIASRLLEIGQERKWISEGQSIELGKAAVEVARKSDYAKKVREDMHGKSDADLNDILREFEPDEPSNK